MGQFFKKWYQKKSYDISKIFKVLYIAKSFRQIEIEIEP